MPKKIQIVMEDLAVVAVVAANSNKKGSEFK